MTELNREPRLTPYRDPSELKILHSWFYDTSKQDNRSRAVQKVCGFAQGGAVPHSIEITSLFTSSILLDECLTKIGVYDDTTVRLSYTMAMIKFVNGILDPYQQSSYAISLHRLAELIKLPSYFVELRHIGTHEHIPTLEMLRWSTRRALQWLDENYWCHVTHLNLREGRPVFLRNGDERFEKRAAVIGELREILHNLKELRLEDSSLTYKEGDMTGDGKFYWEYLNRLKQIAQDSEEMRNLLVQVFIFDPDGIILRSKSLSERAAKSLHFLYKPILQDMGPEFVMLLFGKLYEFMTKNEYLEVVNDVNFGEVLVKGDERYMLPRNEAECVQGRKWIEYMLKNVFVFGKKPQIVRFINEESAEKIVRLISLQNNDESIRMLEFFRDKNSDVIKEVPELSSKIDKALETMNKFKLPDFMVQKPSKRKLDSPASIKASKRKKVKRNILERAKSKNSIFKRYDDWIPVPFGCPGL
ncbi:hypothetical protein BRETT_002765 [Brettanomyces bruxellensis]|uniref:Las1p n=1 Tax=Dekkera bruxellensis TaxID=5007 RepID=A0A871R7W9_DEKBR|nr:uncharacterized protein BRETT_002765 [Brettanomyces bruxellensis]QOU22583.1 hypothetical protein BRETT_002765 [Brettanomyces bruxellensis]